MVLLIQFVGALLASFSHLLLHPTAPRALPCKIIVSVNLAKKAQFIHVSTCLGHALVVCDLTQTLADGSGYRSWLGQLVSLHDKGP